MKRTITILLAVAAILLLTSAAKPAQKRVALYQTNLHCEKCAEKIQNNVAFEKGVVDLEVSVPDKTVRIVYKAGKTDPEKLAKAIASLGYKVELISDKEVN